MARGVWLLGIGLLALAACGSSGQTPPAATPSVGAPTSSSPTEVPTAMPSPSPSSPFTPVDEIRLGPPAAMDAAWTLLFTLPYGDAPDRLGTSPGGEGLTWGPDYGTQMPDGSWWFLDSAHARLARFGETGEYLTAVVLPDEFLADGRYVQYQSPQALADGTLVLSSTTIDAPGLLRMAPDRTLSRVPLAEPVALRANDGIFLYGFGDAGAPVRIDPTTGEIEPVDAFKGQGDEPFSIDVAPGSITISRPGVELDLAMVSDEDPEATVHPAIQVALGADGILSILVVGRIEQTPGDSSVVVGFFRVDREGRVSAIDRMPEPGSAADPGTGSPLGVRHGDTRPWLMSIDTDGVRVYRRGP